MGGGSHMKSLNQPESDSQSNLNRLLIQICRIRMFLGLPDPDPDPLVQDTYGSGSFYHQAKIVRKTLIPTVPVLLCDFFMTFYGTLEK